VRWAGSRPLPEYDDAHPSRDPAFERCNDDECGGTIGADDTCKRCGLHVDDEGDGTDDDESQEEEAAHE
jgi:hypothetical protein